jgi:hypothetical protein
MRTWPESGASAHRHARDTRPAHAPPRRPAAHPPLHRHAQLHRPAHQRLRAQPARAGQPGVAARLCDADALSRRRQPDPARTQPAGGGVHGRRALHAPVLDRRRHRLRTRGRAAAAAGRARGGGRRVPAQERRLAARGPGAAAARGQHARGLRGTPRRVPGEPGGTPRGRRRLCPGAGRAHRLHAHRARRVREARAGHARAALRARPHGRRGGRGARALPLLRRVGRARQRPLPERGLRLLPPLAIHWRAGVRRHALAPHAHRHARLPR